MIRWMLLFVWGLLLLSSLVQGGDATACSLYLAKSSIPNAGWGVFAGRDYKQGERIVSHNERKNDANSILYIILYNIIYKRTRA